MEQRICRRCLLKELGEGYFQNVYEYIKSLPDEIKDSPIIRIQRYEDRKLPKLYRTKKIKNKNLQFSEDSYHSLVFL